MTKFALFCAAALVSLAPLGAAAENKVPAGKENLILDSTSKAKQASGKKVLKGPVPFAHQGHVDAGVACKDCHHKDADAANPQPCHECHKEVKGEAPKESDAFHCGSVESMPSLQSCIGCHTRKVEGTKETNAPMKREPCDACHSIKK